MKLTHSIYQEKDGIPPIKELSPYERWQAERYQNILPLPVVDPDGSCEFESRSEEMQRFSEWNHEQEQQQLLEYEKD